jgi:anti-sigma B factor antagonist
MSHAYARSARPASVMAAQAAGRLEVTTMRTEASCTTLLLRGELDLNSGELLTAVLNNHLAMGNRSLRLDLSRVTFLDCGGLRTLVEGHNRFLAVGGSLVLTGVQPRTARLLHLTHLDEALRVENLRTPPPEPLRAVRTA